MVSLKQADRYLLAAVSVGAIVRLLNLGRDLPYVLHYDEPTLVDNAVWMWENRTLNPHFFNYPTGMIYLLAGLFGLILLGGTMIGQFASWAEALAWLSTGTYDRPPQGGVLYFYPTIGVPLLYLIARGLSVVAGTITIALVYGIAIRAGFGRGAARLAAFAVALSSMAVEHSKLATTDMSATCLATAAIYVALSADREGRRPWIVSGLLTGLAAAFKYNLGLVGGVLVLIALWRRLPGTGMAAWRRLLLAAGVSLATFLLLNPFAVFDTARFARDLGYEFRRVTSVTEMFVGAKEIEPTTVEKLGGIFWLNLGPFGIAAVLFGLVLAVRQRRLGPSLLLAWMAIALLPMLRWQSLYPRYLLGIWPVLLTFAAYGVWEAARMLRRLPFAPALVLVSAAAFYPSEQRLWQRESTRSRPDPRIALTEWLETNLPPGTLVVSEKAGPFATSGRLPIEVVDFLGRSEPRGYLDRGILHLVETGRAALVRGKEQFADLLARQEEIRARSDVLWESGKYRVYRLRGGADWVEPVKRAIAAGDLVTAGTRLEQIVASSPGDRLAWHTLGEVAVMVADTSLALQALERASALDTLQAETALALSQLYIGLGRFDDALRRLRAIEPIAPEDAAMLNNMTVALLSRAQDRRRHGDTAGSRSDWNAASRYAARYVESGKGDPRFNGLRDQVVRMGERWGYAER